MTDAKVQAISFEKQHHAHFDLQCLHCYRGHLIEQNFRTDTNRKLQRLPLHLNDEAFADALVAAWREVVSAASPTAARAWR